MKVTIKRLWKGKTMGKEKMIVPFADLHKGIESPEEFKSRFGGSYHLIDFEWKPDNILKLL